MSLCNDEGFSGFVKLYMSQYVCEHYDLAVEEPVQL